MKNVVPLLTASLLITALCCKKEKAPDRKYNDCYEQYTVSKKLNLGDSVVVPICPSRQGDGSRQGYAGKLDSVSLTFVGYGSSYECRNCHEIQFKTRQTNYSYNFLIYSGSKSRYNSTYIGSLQYRIENVHPDGDIQFKIWYNYK